MLGLQFLMAAAVWLLAATCSGAEKVTLVGGDVMHGRFIKITDSNLTLLHDIFAELEIPKRQIASVTITHQVLGEIEIRPDQIISATTAESEKKKPEPAPAPDKQQARRQAERVTLVAGDLLRGRIIQKTDSSITLLHSVFGHLEIPKDQIATLTVVHDVLGAIEVPTDQILALGTAKPDTEAPQEKKPAPKEQPQQQTEGTKSPEIPAEHIISPDTVEAEKKKPEAAPPPDEQQARQQKEEKEKFFEPEFERLNAWAARLKKTGWSLALDLSLDSSAGSTEEATTRFGAHVRRKLRDERLTVDMSYYHKTSEGDVTDNKFTAGAVHDWLNPGSRWFFFAAGRYDYDEFESWQQRANLQVGPGYNLISTDRALLNLRVGAGGRKEWGSENKDIKLEGLAGFDLKWKLTDRQTFETAAFLFPVLTDFDDYRTRTTLNWRYLMSKELNLSLLFGLVHEYQSIVDPGTEKDDTRIFAGIQMRFE
jgi:putative salt-induced outer membrane protein YdiY